LHQYQAMQFLGEEKHSERSLWTRKYRELVSVYSKPASNRQMANAEF